MFAKLPNSNSKARGIPASSPELLIVLGKAESAHDHLCAPSRISALKITGQSPAFPAPSQGAPAGSGVRLVALLATGIT